MPLLLSSAPALVVDVDVDDDRVDLSSSPTVTKNQRFGKILGSTNVDLVLIK